MQQYMWVYLQSSFTLDHAKKLHLKKNTAQLSELINVIEMMTRNDNRPSNATRVIQDLIS